MNEFHTNSLGDLMKHLSLKYSGRTLDSWRSENVSLEITKAEKKSQKLRKTFLKSKQNIESQVSVEDYKTQHKINGKKEQQKSGQLEESKLSWNQNIEEYVSQLLVRNEELRNELIQMRELVMDQESVINIMASKLI